MKQHYTVHAQTKKNCTKQNKKQHCTTHTNKQTNKKKQQKKTVQQKRN